MANFARRIVSGNKARFKDEELDVELDLVYVTDNVIIMGYPAEGMEAFYRNSKHDARKFLEHRHQQNYWIFNFCPLTENSYPADFFHGHVSRYPFPDHHAPPLAIMALAVREMDLWLRKSPDNVIVLHCKAGKGRSGTLACSYLLTLEEVPTGPRLERSHTRKEWANKRAAEMMAAVISISESDAAGELEAEATVPPPEAQPNIGTTLSLKDGVISQNYDENTADHGTIGPGDNVKIEQRPTSPTHTQPLIPTPDDGQTDTPDSNSPASSSPAVSRTATSIASSRVSTTFGYGLGMTNAPAANSASSLDSVLALHSARRMRALSKNGPRKTPRRGVSIPSQRRFLFYWSQILSGVAPRGFWEVASSQETVEIPQQQVRICSFTIRMLDPGTAKQTAVKVISKVLEKTGVGKVHGNRASGDIWVSLARYDDELVNTLEGWEKHTRDPDPRRMGRRRLFSEAMPDPVGAGGEQGITKLFDDGKWDSGKMVRSFARLGLTDKEDICAKREDDVKVVTYILRPLTQPSWINVAKNPPKENSRPPIHPKDDEAAIVSDDSVSTVSVNAEANLAQEEVEKDDIVLDANREVRAKLFIGSVPMGWLWFVPAFHMARAGLEPVHLKLTRKEVDFPLGAGSWIIDVDIELEWVRRS